MHTAPVRVPFGSRTPKAGAQVDAHADIAHRVMRDNINTDSKREQAHRA